MLKANAYAKINWLLRITGRRSNGYHLLDSLMQPIALHDEIAVERVDDGRIEMVGDAPCPPQENLIYRGAQALQAFTGTSAGARIRLKKQIPAKAGLGGGSTDCATTLLLLRTLWELPISNEQLAEIGLRLGADVPYCLKSCFCRVQGIGEIVMPLEGAREIPLVLLIPKKGVSTAAAFAALDENYHQNDDLGIDRARKALSNGDWAQYTQLAGNDLLAPAVQMVEEIGASLALLRENGALYASMSGSGSAVFGVYSDMQAAQDALSHLGAGAIVTKTMIP